ncbi:MAG: hypothetical protein CMO40_09630 [Verrucomicrobiaceae bacterium]|nr:hypothetical protein [Verrucomicrobiaceae bacterium]
MIAPLHGLLLAGGKSRRMGSDKADLIVNGHLSLRERGLQLLNGVTEATYLSIARNDNRAYQARTVRDSRTDAGPLGGLEAAFQNIPGAAWLVTACDLPFLTKEVLQHLCHSRDPACHATCFTSRFDGKPEPLCTIYEPTAATHLKRALDNKAGCARKFLISLDRREVSLPDEAALDNCNRPEDLEEARCKLTGECTSKKITVEYCGVLREDAGRNSEEMETEASTAAGLWEELRMARSLSLQLDTVRIAVNDEFQPWSYLLADGDRLTLFPPFAGG